MTAAISLYAIIASQRFMPDQIEHAQFVRQRPCFRFINPHQRSMKHELLVHGKVQCHIQRLDKSIPAIGITAEVCLRHTGHDMIDPQFACIDSCNAQKEQIPPRHKRIRETIGRLHLIHRYRSICQRIFTQVAYKGNIHRFKLHPCLSGNSTGQLHFLHMLLSIDKA